MMLKKMITTKNVIFLTVTQLDQIIWIKVSKLKERYVGKTLSSLSSSSSNNNNNDKDLSKKIFFFKVIRMLFVIVTEFFVCWAPLHVLNTWYLFYPDAIYKYLGSTGISLVQLLAYISSCCNPITYCFMNKKFRQAFISVFNRYR